LSTIPSRVPFLLIAVTLAACGGSQSPPPPVSSPTPGAGGSDMRALSSREAGRTPAASAPEGPDSSPSLPPGHPPIGGAAMGSTAPGSTAERISGTIVVSPKLASALASTDILYVMAKKGSATLAVRRIEKPTFPLDFQLSGGDAMMSGSAFEGPVDVVARISKTGDAIPARGDLEGTARDVKVPAKGVVVTIDRTRE
jgi:hypothetical protein